jgi:hypothetical protein
VVFIGRHLDRAAFDQAWKATHLTYTEGRKGLACWAERPDPFPQWESAPEHV